jgi:hypothetical protein
MYDGLEHKEIPNSEKMIDQASISDGEILGGPLAGAFIGLNEPCPVV